MAEIDLLNNKLKALEQQMALLLKHEHEEATTTIQHSIISNVPLPKPIDLTNGNISEQWNFFKSSWENYCVASDMNKQSNEKQIAVLLSCIGDELFKRYNNMNISADDKNTANRLIIAIGKQLTPEKNKRYERAIFNLAKQENDEPYDVYFDRLRGLIKHCEYGELLNDLLLDKIICSIHDINMRERLWLDKNVTLETAIELCRAKQESTKQLLELENNKHEINLDVNKIVKNEMSSNYSRRFNKNTDFTNQRQNDNRPQMKCFFCGFDFHRELNDCPAKNENCNYCLKKGHFARVCMGKKRQQQEQPSQQQQQHYQQRSQQRKTENMKTYEEQHILSLDSNIKNKRTATILMNGKEIECELDTGANCNAIGYENLCKHMKEQQLNIRPPTARLKVFGDFFVYPKGIVTLNLKYENETLNTDFHVVNHKTQPILSSDTCEFLGLVKICNIIKNDNINNNPNLNMIINEFHDVFEGLGELPGEVTLHIDENIKARKQAFRRVPIPLREELKSKLEELENMKVITKQHEQSEWLSNLVLVKKNNKLRLCLDPHELNKSLKAVKFPTKTIEEILPELKNAKVFSTLDAKNGFWQLKLDNGTSNLTTFSTPFGNYKFLRMPFGIKTAMEIFQQKQNEVLQGLEGVESIADDLLVFGRGENIETATKDHNKNLIALLQRLRQSNMKLNKEKARFCVSTVKFYGHILTNDGVKADESKISAIKNFPRPKDKNELSRFLGMATYLSKFFDKLSNESVPLRKLLAKNEEFIWENEHEGAFQKIKNRISQLPTLSYFNDQKELKIQTDASSFALGCVLQQENRPVAYASKKLTETQKNYSQIEKEMLAIVFACDRFHQYICGKEDVIVETDHLPLVNIFKKPLLDVPKRLQAMILNLQRYSLKIKYTKGSEMYIADTLSRAPESIINVEKSCDIYTIENEMKYFDEINILKTIHVNDSTIENIRTETSLDNIMTQLHGTIKSGWPENIKCLSDELKPYWNVRHELHIQDGLILKKDRILIPSSLRKQMLSKLHVPHMGIENSLKLARETIFWPGMTDQITQLIKNCETCIKHSCNKQKEPMQSHEVPTYPFEYISMDVFEITLDRRARRFLITVDHFSDFFEIDELTDMTSKSTILACKRHFSRYGSPRVVITDNGTNFSSEEFKTFARTWGFQHSTSDPMHQQGNGKSESAVKICKSILRKTFEDKNDFYEALQIWRNTPNKINISPSQRFLCRPIRCSVPKANLLQKVPEKVNEKITKHRAYYKQFYDRAAKPFPGFIIGENVYVKMYPSDKKWTPGYIQHQFKDRSYIVNVNGRTVRRNQIHIKSGTKNGIANTNTQCETDNDFVEPDENLSSTITNFQTPNMVRPTNLNSNNIVTRSSTISNSREISNGESSNQNLNCDSTPRSSINHNLRPRRLINKPRWLNDYYDN